MFSPWLKRAIYSIFSLLLAVAVVTTPVSYNHTSKGQRQRAHAEELNLAANSGAAHIIASPDLLGDNGEDGESKKGNQEETGEGGQGTAVTFSAYLNAAGHSAGFSEDAFSATEPNMIVALAQAEGDLRLNNCRINKSGNLEDGDDAKAASDNATNGAALATGAGSRVALSECAINDSANYSSALAATNKGTLFANKTTALCDGATSKGVYSAGGATLVGNNLGIETKGADSPAVVTAASSATSLANSTVATAGSASCLIDAKGTTELDNFVGSTGASTLARLQSSNRLLINGSRLSSAMASKQGGDPTANAIMLYGTESEAAKKEATTSALLQAQDSTFNSSLESGSLIYATNTRANILLSKCNLNFNNNTTKLLSALGNNANQWGDPGHNGAEVDFTAIEQKLKGVIEADTLSTLDCFLLNGSQWTGSSNIVSSATTAATTDNLSVNIDATSSWIVTEDSTVSSLNLAPGGKLVDSAGASVKIVDSNHFTLVDGASSTTITVTGSFSTSVKTTAANELQKPTISREEFDKTFGINTTFGQNGSSALTPDELRIQALVEAVARWFNNL